jgi:dGTPase
MTHQFEPVSPERIRRWEATMHGFSSEASTDSSPPPDQGDRGPFRFAHADSTAVIGPFDSDPALPSAALEAGTALGRVAREAVEDALFAPGATRADGAGRRRHYEMPDAWRTCFERDRDRILHSSAFRRLAGKTQVFVFAEDHQRTRLTHALEVAQVACSVARACRLNVVLTEAIALGHDCGHGPGGHASEDALDPYLPEGFNHAPWGAHVSLEALNLCAETADGIAQHSWSRPAPATPEGEIVSWADRIAYVCHDWEDAVRAGIVTPSMLPEIVRERCGARRGRQLDCFIEALIRSTLATGAVCMEAGTADTLGVFRAANYEYIYLREASQTQARAVIAVLRALTEYYADRPHAIPAVQELGELRGGEPGALRAAVTYVAGMTDRFAFRQALALLNWDPAKLPTGIGA